MVVVSSYSLNITNKNGTVTKSPAKLAYSHGDVVTLTATPNVGYRFTGWTGDVTEKNRTIKIKVEDHIRIVSNYENIIHKPVIPIELPFDNWSSDEQNRLR